MLRNYQGSMTLDGIEAGKLSLCMILMRETPLILLDEENRRIVKRLFRNFQQKRFFVVSHDHEIFDDSFRIHKICDGN